MAKKSKRAATKKRAANSRKKTAKRKVTRKAAVRRAPKAPTNAGSKSWAVVGTLPILGWLLVLLLGKKDPYTRYYARQGLALGLAVIVLDALLMMLIITMPLTMLVGIAAFVLWLISVSNALSGRKKPTPLVGQLAEKLAL